MWSSKKYKKAADRHYLCCKHLMDNLHVVKSDAKPHVTNNLYYLSGYILECILKSYYLELNHKKQSYNLLQLEEMGLKTHDIKSLFRKVMNEGRHDIKKFNWTNLSNRWSESVRYDDQLDFNNITLVKEHFESTVIPIYIKIKELY